jgi:colicin import membrane protein
MLNPYVDLLVEARIKQQNLALAEEKQAAALEALQKKYDLLIGVRKEEDKDATRRLEDITRYVERLKEQADTLGFNTLELVRYKAAQMGANEEQTKALLLSAQRIDQYKAEQEAIKQAEAEAKKQATQAATAQRQDVENKKRLDEKMRQILNAEARQAEIEQASIDQRAVQIAESLMSEEEQIRLSYERRSQTILDSTLLTGQQVNEAMAGFGVRAPRQTESD